MTRSSYGIAKQHFFVDANMSEVLEEDASETVIAGTKVVITLGPACRDVETLCKLLLAGVSCARIDLTWGTLKFHRTSLENLSQAMRQTKRLCSVILDTTGREICVHRPMSIDDAGWMSQKEELSFTAGQEVVITTNTSVKATSSLLPVNVPKFCELVEPGQILHIGRFLNTGAEGSSLFLQVKEQTGTELICVALNTAKVDGLLIIVVSHRAFRLQQHESDLNAELPLLTANDIAAIKEFGKDFEIDFINLSYCNSAEDVAQCRETLDACGLAQTKILAKVERKAAIHNFNSIVEAADGIIFSRGNLGVDFEPEEMAQLQKLCVNRCNALGKSIIMTRCVDTMVNTPRPTRAEATDVANAILDGVDGILLGAETLRGLYPVITVDTIMRLCASAEKYFDYRNHHEHLMAEESVEEDYTLENRFGSTLNLSDSPKAAMQRNAAFAKRAISFADFAQTRSSAAAPPPPPPSLTRSMSSFGNLPRVPSGDIYRQETVMSKLESIASSAARVAEKISAGLIVVLAQTGRTVSLVAKYRPPMPILSVVVPTLKSSKLGWKLEGKYLARQCLIMRGVFPLMAAPMTGGAEALLAEAIASAHNQELVKPNQYVVCIMSVRGALMLKVVQVNDDGTGIRATMLGNPKALHLDLVNIKTAVDEPVMKPVGSSVGFESVDSGVVEYQNMDSPYSGITTSAVLGGFGDGAAASPVGGSGGVSSPGGSGGKPPLSGGAPPQKKSSIPGAALFGLGSKK